MPLFRITVIRRVNTNGVRLEPGMSVEVVTNSYSDPVHTNGGQCTPHRGPSRRNKTVSINTITLPECRYNDIRAVFWRANFNERL